MTNIQLTYIGHVLAFILAIVAMGMAFYLGRVAPIGYTIVVVSVALGLAYKTYNQRN